MNLSAQEPKNPSRRSFFEKISTWLMGAGLLAAYGSFFLFAARFLYPAKPRKKGWMYVIETKRMRSGDSLTYVSPIGSKIAIARRSENGAIQDFIALSSVCPHLGCQVHWESQHNRFFCPCHNGAFTPEGKAIMGPPAEMNQSLFKYPLKIENETLFIEVPLEKLAGDQPGFKIPSGPAKPIS
jgi:cytochrome b6-f complex iron-sulfur subunit